MKFQIRLFIFTTLFIAVTADTLLRSQPLHKEKKNDVDTPHYSKEQINHFKEMIKAHRKKIEQARKHESDRLTAKKPAGKKIAEKSRVIVTFDEPTLDGQKKVAKRDTLLRDLPVQREDRRAILLFKNGVASEDGEIGNQHAEQVKHREDKKVIITFKNGEHQETDKHFSKFVDSNAKKVAKRDTLLRSLETGEKSIAKRDTLLRSLETKDEKNVAKRDTLLRSLPAGDKRAQHDALLEKLRERYPHLKHISKRDTLLKSLPANAEKKNIEPKRAAMLLWKSSEILKNGGDLAARRREAIRNFLKNRKQQKTVAQRDTLLRSGDWPGFPRKKRDIAATVVGAAVSSVVSNLMKTVEESVVKAESEAKKLQSDVLDSDQGRIIDQGEMAAVSNDVGPQSFPAAPVSNEAVPFPFAPVKAYDAPKSNDLLPKPFAPVHADVEVIVGNNSTSTSTTSAPATDKKGFFATLFNSFKLLFGTVTNSVGGFFIDVGSRITNFVEKRIKV